MKNKLGLYIGGLFLAAAAGSVITQAYQAVVGSAAAHAETPVAAQECTIEKIVHVDYPFTLDLQCKKGSDNPYRLTAWVYSHDSGMMPALEYKLKPGTQIELPGLSNGYTIFWKNGFAEINAPDITIIPDAAK